MTGAGENLKLATYSQAGGAAVVGVVRGDHIWPFPQVAEGIPVLHSMLDVIKGWDSLKDKIAFTGDGVPLAQVTLLAPIPEPAGAVLCIGKNYADHVQEVDRWGTDVRITAPSTPTHPIVFTKTPQSVIGPGAAIRYPHGLSQEVDYEAELAVVIGKGGRGISAEHAMDHVFGYTICNDVTARDLQKRHQQWYLGKSCDTFCPLGPWIVPASEINGQDLQIQCWVDGELRQDGRTSQLLFDIPTLIQTISAGITLLPGTIIATGTPAGVGSGFNPPRHLKPGSIVRIAIEGIGELTNPVV